MNEQKREESFHIFLRRADGGGAEGRGEGRGKRESKEKREKYWKEK